MFEIFLLLLYFPFAFPILYYWIALDEMKGQHPVRRVVWLVLVPPMIILIPFTATLSLIPMMVFIAMGEAFDKPKETPKTKTDLEIERFFSKTPFRRAMYIAFSICVIVLLALMFIRSLIL